MPKGPRSTNRRSVGKRKLIKAQGAPKRNDLSRFDHRLEQLHRIGIKLLMLLLLITLILIVAEQEIARVLAAV